jgi:hypothetical protein
MRIAPTGVNRQIEDEDEDKDAGVDAVEVVALEEDSAIITVATHL